MRTRTVLAGLVLAAALVVMLGLGFVAGRKVPKGFVERLRARAGLAYATDLESPWRELAPTPFQVFESASAVTGDTLLVFGGFGGASLEASPAVWSFESSRNVWTRRKDMPKAWTHSAPARLGGVLWFAGGFLGNSPGPATAEVWRYDPRDDSWSSGPPLPGPRGSGSLVAFDGTLHYFGGYLEDRDTPSADHWVLSPGSADSTTWVRAADLPVPRGHMAGAAINGGIYAIGGCVHHDPYPIDVDVVQRYDPATDRWTAVASLPAPRSHFEPATFVRQGRIVIIGGRSRTIGQETVSDVTEYDPVADRWRALPPIPGPRLAPFGGWVGNRILVGVGGRVGGKPDSDLFWELPDSAAWFPGDSLPVPLGEVSAGIIGDRLYLVGQGNRSTLTLDLRTGRWLPRGVAASDRPAWGNHHAAEVWNGRLYLLGALDRGQGQVQIYDPATNAWTLGPPMPFAAGSSASGVIGGKVYVSGGIVGDSTTGLGARFDPEAGTWTAIAPMPRPRNHAASAADGQRLFVFGGRGPGSGDSNVVADGFADVQIYDPATDSWTVSGTGPGSPAPLPEGRGGMGKGVFANGEFWVFGGETLHGHGATSHGTYARVDVYNPATNAWRSGPPLPSPRHGIFPLLDGDRILILGGGTAAGASRTQLSEILQLPRGTR